eukprot:9305572-Pyramimonas_sp.AAC.1
MSEAPRAPSEISRRSLGTPQIPLRKLSGAPSGALRPSRELSGPLGSVQRPLGSLQRLLGVSHQFFGNPQEPFFSTIIGASRRLAGLLGNSQWPCGNPHKLLGTVKKPLGNLSEAPRSL